jgi:hypothetical protein
MDVWGYTVRLDDMGSMDDNGRIKCGRHSILPSADTNCTYPTENTMHFAFLAPLLAVRQSTSPPRLTF